MSRKDFPSDRPRDTLQTQLVAGLGLAAVPIVYGVVGLVRGSIWIYLIRSSGNTNFIEFSGEAGVWFAVAFIALGVAVHFHYFWGYSENYWRYSDYGRNLATVVCVGSFFYALHLFFGSFF